jgi:hypothetical protein
MKKTKTPKAVKEPAALKKIIVDSPKKSSDKSAILKKIKSKESELKRVKAKNEEKKALIVELEAGIAELKTQIGKATRIRLEKAFAEMIKTQIHDHLNTALIYLTDIHPDLTGRPVFEALKEVLIHAFQTIDKVSRFTNAPEIRKESLDYFRRILERERKRSAAEKKRSANKANSHSFRLFCKDVILFALYLKQNGWKRHWLHVDFPGDFRDAKNKEAWRRYLRNLISKCFIAGDYPLSKPDIKGYASSRFHSQVGPAIEEILALDDEKLSKEMEVFVFWKINWFVTKMRQPTLQVLADMFPGCT